MPPPNVPPFWAFVAVFTYAVLKCMDLKNRRDFVAGGLGLTPGAVVFGLCEPGPVS